MSAGQSQIERMLIEQYIRSRKRTTFLAIVALAVSAALGGVLIWSLAIDLQQRSAEVTRAEGVAARAENRLQAERDYVASLERDAASIDTSVGSGPLSDEQIEAIVQRSSADLRVRYAQLDLVPIQAEANATARNLETAREDLEQATQWLWAGVGGVTVVLLGLTALVGVAKRKEALASLQFARGEGLDMLVKQR